MSLTIVTGPDIEPIPLSLARQHLRADDDEAENLYISTLVAAAREYCEASQGRAYITREYALLVPAAVAIELPMAPLQEVTEVAALDAAGVSTEITGYTVDATGAIAVVSIDEPPSGTEHIQITYTAGYGDACADVPARMRQAMLLLIGHWYATREAVATNAQGEVPFAVSALLTQDRVQWGF